MCVHSIDPYQHLFIDFTSVSRFAAQWWSEGSHYLHSIHLWCHLLIGHAMWTALIDQNIKIYFLKYIKNQSFEDNPDAISEKSNMLDILSSPCEVFVCLLWQLSLQAELPVLHWIVHWKLLLLPVVLPRFRIH